MAKTVVPTDHLCKEGKVLFKCGMATHDLDEVGQHHLLLACEAYGRLREAQAILKKQGLTTRDRNGILRPHPATVIERNARSAYQAAFKLLRLEPLEAPEAK